MITIPRVRLVIDGKVEFDGELDSWSATAPDYFRDKLRPDVQPEPWLKVVLVLMADAAMTGQSVNIDVRIEKRKWYVSVEEA